MLRLGTKPPIGTGMTAQNARRFLTQDDSTWSGARVTVMGLGLFGGGVAAARFAAERGARVTVTDKRPGNDLAESIDALRGLDLRFVLGHHDEDDFRNADIVIVNPAVPRESPLLQTARESGATLTTEIALFSERCKGRIIAVSGSNGKTTTTSLIGAIMQLHDHRTRVGGNLGKSLLNEVSQIEPGVPVVLEVSSFQLEWLGDEQWAPEIGVLTNLSPNHLDRHGTYENYVAAKRFLLAHQSREQIGVLNAADPLLANMAANVPGTIRWFSNSVARTPGAYVVNGSIVFTRSGDTVPVMEVEGIPLPGAHNQENVLAAVSATSAWEYDGAVVEPITMANAIQSFHAVEHRLEFVAEIAGVRYYNDSIATTPESAICALKSFETGRTVLIAGGYDKKISFDSLGVEIAKRARVLIVLGVTASQIAEAAQRAGMDPNRIHHVADMAAAVDTARCLARKGDVVTLSPACASYDHYRNFSDRGMHFKSLVHTLRTSKNGQHD